MKNKKFLAGATLAAFATTLVPVAAFAADDVTPTLGASKVTITTDKADADRKVVTADGVTTVDADSLELYVDLRSNSGEKVNTLQAASTTGSTLVVWAERNDDIVSDVDYITTEDGTVGDLGVYTTTTLENNDPSIKFYVQSKVSGDVAVRAALVPTDKFEDSTVAVWEDYLLGTSKVTGEFEAVHSNDWKLFAEHGDTNDTLTDGQTSDIMVTGEADGLDPKKITLQLTDENGEYVTDEKVKITGNKNGLILNKTEDTTDSRGSFDFKVSADKPGEYEVDIEAGSNDYTLVVEFTAAGVYDLELESAIEGAIALDEETDLADVLLKDANGNELDLDELPAGDVEDLFDFTVVSEPEDSDIDEERDFTIDKTDDEITIEFTPEAEGHYEIKIALDETGKNEVVEFEVVEQGDIVKLDLEYDAESLMLGATSEIPDVYYVDADGVRAKATSGVEFAATGNAVDEIDGNGAVTLKDDHDYAGSTVKVTAVSERHDVVATHSFNVVEEAQGIEFLTTDIAANTDNKVQYAVVDSEGNKVALGNDYDVVDTSYVVLSQPEGGKVSVDFQNDGDDLLDKGVATMEIYSTEEGEVEIQVVVKVQTEVQDAEDEDSKDKFEYYTGTAVFNVGKEAATGNAGVVTMFIGSTNFMVDGESTTMDVAPFIQDNRTFVPVRAFGEAVGAEVVYDEATQVITAVKGDVTVTMTVGKNIITTSEGETITADVAPFVKDGRTVLPLRAAAEAFGCDVEAISAVDGSTTGVIFTVK